ncbi:MAG: beta-lactamase family protein, partial [Gemmatimonadetes bacterium]|nr:beta-lactamase family protein [Gemmatimonadota bacterium]
VERATGLTLRAFADRHFFRPFGMLDSHFHDDADHVVPSRATGYRPARAADGADAVDGAGDGFRMEHRWDFAQVGSGGVYSSVRDMARWEAAFHAGAVGPAGFTESLLERGVLASGDTLPYAFGVTLGEHRGLRTIAHGGSLAGFRSHVMRFPDEGTSVVVLCNVTNADPSGRATRVAEIVLGDRMAPPAARSADEGGARPRQEAEAPRPLTPPQLAELAGRYRSEELGVTSEIRVVDGGLVRDGRTPLRHVGRDELAGAGAVLRFQRDRRGRITGYVLDAGRASGIVFERVDG